MRVEAAPQAVGASLAGLHRWSLSGATQHPSGAIAGWRDARTGALSCEYPEITGYFLTYWAASPVEPAVARRAASWLANRVGAGNLSAGDDGPIYNFDLAMMATGLVNAGEALAEGEYVQAGLALVERLRRQVERRGLLPALDPSGGPCLRAPSWSTVGRAHLVKAVQAFLIADRRGVGGMAEAAAALVAHATTVTGPGPADTWLHALLYAAEGHWVWGTAQSDSAALALARRLVARAWLEQLPNGGFPAAAGRAPVPCEQGDVLAQVLRMSVAVDVRPPGLDAAVRRLCEISVPCPEGNAVLYRPGSDQRHENTWSTLFAAQALESILHEQAPRWTTLV